MSETYDRLPPDQRAVLSLVLERGKSYAEVAAMLSISEATVRERAHSALDALALGDAVAHGSTAAAMPSDPAAAAAPAPAQPAPSEPSFPRASSHGASRLPSSRTGGALLLAGIAVIVVVAVVLITNSGGGKSASTAHTGTATSPSNASARIDKKLTLAAVEPESSARGEAYVLSDGARHAFYVAAQHLPPSHGFFYAVWLYNSPSSSAPLGRAPSVGSNGRLEGGGPLPNNAADYAKLILTRETNTRARRPGTIVLSGDFALR